MSVDTPVPPVAFDHFLTCDEVTAYCQGLAAARPDHCRLDSLGPSRQGRQVHLLTLADRTTADAAARPAYLIHANIHASEVSGTQMALHTARQLLTDDLDLLAERTVYVVPRLNPDGAEICVTTGDHVRSRTDVDERIANHLYAADVDGDGRVLKMRWQDADGGWVRDPDEPRLMVPRRADSQGPFYHVMTEGLIHDWDGGGDLRSGGRGFDWNRNWSYDWRPEPEQDGAGDFPFSEPEMRHLGEFLHGCGQLFGVLGYHTGPAAVLRPPSTGSDADLPEADVHMMEDLARHGADATGFPVVPVVKYRRRWQRDIHLRGHFHNFGYHHLGLFVFEFELGTARDSAGLDLEAQMGVFRDEEQQAQMRHLLRWWDEQDQRSHPLFVDWRAVAHPQLGAVEIGGFLSTGIANQTSARLREIARGTHDFTLEHLRRAPRVVLEDVVAEAVADGIVRVRARVANRGSLPTHVSARGAQLRRLRRVRVELDLAAGVELLSQQGHLDVGHLAGVTGSRRLEWFLRAPAAATLAAGGLGEIRVCGGAGGDARAQVTL